LDRALLAAHCSPYQHVALHFFKLDWLHVMDLGVSADISGNVFWLLEKTLPGANVKARISELYQKLSKFYKENKVQDKVITSTETMIRPSSQLGQQNVATCKFVSKDGW